MRSTYITAIVIAIAVSLWLASGRLGGGAPTPPQTIAEQNRLAGMMLEERSLTRVRVGRVHASRRTRLATIRGRTRNKRTVTVRAQLSGTLVDRPVERGDRVKAGALLCSVSVDDRQATLRQSAEALNQARIEYEGSLRLSREGLQSETAIAQAKARLAVAEAGLKRAELGVDHLSITAPFDGVVEEVGLEQGDYVTPGAACATLVDLDPMLLVGRLPEKDIANVRLGVTAEGIVSTGVKVSGPVTFVGRTAEDATRTYGIEIQIPNADYAIPSGVSVRIDVPVETIMAQKLSPALLALDDLGQMGIRTVDADNAVQFHPVEIVADAVDGIWVTGLPAAATIITVGQELVVAGEKVEPVFTTTN